MHVANEENPKKYGNFFRFWYQKSFKRLKCHDWHGRGFSHGVPSNESLPAGQIGTKNTTYTKKAPNRELFESAIEMGMNSISGTWRLLKPVLCKKCIWWEQNPTLRPKC